MTDIKLGKYKHFKGKYYEVIGLAIHTETSEEMVVYRALYGEYGLFVRPLKMWNEEVNGVKRFTYVGDNNDGKNINN